MQSIPNIRLDKEPTYRTTKIRCGHCGDTREVTTPNAVEFASRSPKCGCRKRNG